MLLVPCKEGYLAVAQPDQGLTCGQIGRAWGNDLFGDVVPRDEVVYAAEVHDDGWAEWERAPTLDAHTGLPHTFTTAPYTVNLAIHARFIRQLVEVRPYAGMLVVLHHASFFPRPGRLGRLRRGGRRIDAFRRELDAAAARALGQIDATEDELERNGRLVTVWDAISHDLLVNPLPRVRRNVPARVGTLDLTVTRAGEHHVVAPWPFATAEVTIETQGRLLRETYTDASSMRRALESAPLVPLRYTLRPPPGLTDETAAVPLPG